MHDSALSRRARQALALTLTSQPARLRRLSRHTAVCMLQLQLAGCSCSGAHWDGLFVQGLPMATPYSGREGAYARM